MMREVSHVCIMIFKNFVELHCLMLHAKFQNHRPSGSGEKHFLKVFAMHSHSGHFGHVTLTIYTNFCSPFLKLVYHWHANFSHLLCEFCRGLSHDLCASVARVS